MSGDSQKFEGKQMPPVLRSLRQAFDNKNKEELRRMIDYIQQMVQRGGTSCSSMKESDLEELLNKGTGTIYVGTGTSGQRIFIENNELWMPYSEGKDAELGRHYHLNFEYLFDVPQGEELRVKF